MPLHSLANIINGKAFKALSLMLGTASSILLTGCGGVDDKTYSEYHRIPNEGWRFDKPVEFTPVHSDSICEGVFIVGLRHDDNYPYTKVSLELQNIDADNNLHCDTANIDIIGSHGQFLGIGIGSSFQLTDTLKATTHISGTPVKVRHLMRTDTLPGIRQLGVFFVPAKKDK